MNYYARKECYLGVLNYSSLKPRSLFLLTLGTVFIIELTVMLLFSTLPPLQSAVEAVLDAFLLSVVFVPFLYIFFLQPYKAHVRLTSEAEAERRRIGEVNRIKNEIISTAAHELRTPLAAIMGYAELLQMDTSLDHTKRAEYTDTIIAKVELMERLINDLLDLSNVEQGRSLSIQRGQGDIVATITAIVGEYRLKYPGRPFHLGLPVESAPLVFDRVRIEQVLTNLLSNAVKFSPPQTPIAIAGVIADQAFQVQISDQGRGMTTEQLNQVFDKFYRADMSNTASEGLGLGMAIAKEIVLSHGGSIWLESTVGKGTTVYFTLPL